jgi:hypothetical protein
MTSKIILSVLLYFLVAGVLFYIRYIRSSPRSLWRKRLTPHVRLGPSLFVLLGAVTSYLAYWFPLWRDRQYPADFDTRIGFLVVGFAPFTTGMAVFAAFSYFRLYRIQRQSSTSVGWLLLCILAVPMIFSGFTGAKLLPAAILELPSFIMTLVFLPIQWIFEL